MKKHNLLKSTFAILCVLVLLIVSVTSVCAHSGRTDSSGGHNDNKNKSGLGSYHYHCGGYPAHLHNGGYCPYTDVFPKSVTISAGKTTLGIGETTSISASIYPANSCNTNLRWESSDRNVVVVSGDTIEAIGYGTAVLTATTFNDVVGSIKISVIEIVAQRVDVTLTDTTKTVIYIGDNFALNASITPSNVDNPLITWNSSNPDVATVDQSGNVTALIEGSSNITATASNGVVGTYVLNVQEKKVETVTVTEESADLFLGDKLLISATIFPEDATFPELTWSTDNEAVVAVSADGEISCLGVGTATVTVAAKSGVTDSVIVTVSEIKAESLEIEGPDSVKIGESVTLTAVLLPKDTYDKRVEWSSSDESIAIVDADGRVTTFATGTVTITANQKDIEKKVEFTVLPTNTEDNMDVISSIDSEIKEEKTNIIYNLMQILCILFILAIPVLSVIFIIRWIMKKSKRWIGIAIGACFIGVLLTTIIGISV